MSRIRTREERDAGDEQDDDKNCSFLLPAELANAIAAEALRAYKAAIPSSAAVPPTQSSVFAAIVMQRQTSSLKAVSVGLGTHVVPLCTTTTTTATRTAADAALCLHDLHAEVLARRGLIRFLLNDAALAVSSSAAQVFECVDNNNNGALRIKDATTRFHLFVTQTPCGDASVFPGARHGARCFRHVASDSEMRAHEEAVRGAVAVAPSASASAAATSKKGNDDERAGNGDGDDGDDGDGDDEGGFLVYSAHCNAVDDDREGCARLKPGKGPRSTSMSCSDKICKWLALGLEGAAAGTVLPRIDLASVVVLADDDDDDVGSGEDCHSGSGKKKDPQTLLTATTMKRAFLDRLQFFDPDVSRRFRVGAVSAAAAAIGGRPFLRTSDAVESSNNSCAVGFVSGGGSWNVQKLTGRDGAAQGSTPKGRNHALTKAVAASATATPSTEPLCCRRAVLRSVVRVSEMLRSVAAAQNEGGADDNEKEVSYLQLKKSNRGHAAAKERFHSTRGQFSVWAHEKASQDLQSKIVLVSRKL